jgi:hypothetical protein
MPESYTPREFIDTINSKSPGGVKYDPYGTEVLRRQAQEKAEGGSIFAEARQAIAERSKTPEEKIAEAKEQIEAMREWLINDGTYNQGKIEDKINRLKVTYDESEEQAVVKGNLSLGVLESAKDLTLPQTITGDLWLSGLKSAEHLALPQTINGTLNLSGLKSAEHLALPQTINGTLYLDGLTPAERNQIRAQRPDLADKIFPKY